MIPAWPRVGPLSGCTALIRCFPEDFVVHEELGFEPGGGGEHAFLHLEKRGLDTAYLVQRVSSLSGVHPRDIGFSGMKDRHAVTRQWLSVRLAGRTEPDWGELEQVGAAHRVGAVPRGAMTVGSALQTASTIQENPC